MSHRTMVLAALLALGPGVGHAKVNWTSVTKPFGGIEVRKGRTGDNKNDVYAALISLCNAYVHVAATAPATSLQTPGSWAGKVGVQLAVNGDFYKWDSSCSYPFVYGDAVGNGKRWPGCRNGNDASHSSEWFYMKYGWIAFGQDWAEFSYSKLVKQKKLGDYGWQPTSVTTSIPSGTQALVSGFSQLVIDGKKVTCSSPTASTCFPDRSDLRQRHPRTAMGLTQDRRTLILAVVDGRTSKSIGMYGTELAALMEELGAFQAFNLDGGGSSAMWVKGKGYVNNPSDGSARAVANHWGIYAGSATGKSKTPGSCFVAGGCYPTRLVGAESAAFKDMPPTSLGYAQAKLLHNQKLITLCRTKPDPMFCPNCPITRREFVTTLVRTLGLSTASPPAEPSFSDMPADDPDYALIEAAATAGIVTGYSSGKFLPEGSVPRGQAAVLITRAAGWTLVNPATATFSDVPTTHGKFKYVETIKSKCVTNGCGGGKFCPDDAATRAQAAIFVVRAFNLDGKNTCLEEPGDPYDGGIADDGSAIASDTDGADLGGGPSGDGGTGGVFDDGGLALDEGTDGGCSCSLSSPPAPPPGWLALILLLGLLPLRRRR
jgi:MYXO-CTERM domain-containing protein